MNPNWDSTCTHCHRRSINIRDNGSCPWCGQCSAKWERWLDGHINLTWLALILIVMMVLFAMMISSLSAHADEPPIVTKRNDKIILNYSDGSFEQRKYKDSTVHISGERNGKLYFDIRPKSEVKIEDIESGVYSTIKRKQAEPD
jgi:hypothetical protein